MLILFKFLISVGLLGVSCAFTRLSYIFAK